jgi:hypothetical protein
LITQASSGKGLSGKGKSAAAPELAESDLASVFGIELETPVQPSPLPKAKTVKKPKTPSSGKSARKPAKALPKAQTPKVF